MSNISAAIILGNLWGAPVYAPQPVYYTSYYQPRPVVVHQYYRPQPVVQKVVYNRPPQRWDNHPGRGNGHWKHRDNDRGRGHR